MSAVTLAMGGEGCAGGMESDRAGAHSCVASWSNPWGPVLCRDRLLAHAEGSAEDFVRRLLACGVALGTSASPCAAISRRCCCVSATRTRGCG